MSTLEIWIVIVGLTFVTIFTRSSFLLLGERFALPERVQHALRYAPVCALMALITPELFFTAGALDLSAANPKLVAGVAAAVATLILRSMIAAIVIGMLVFTALRLFI